MAPQAGGTGTKLDLITYNLRDYYYRQEYQRYGQVEEVLAGAVGARPAIVAVQELVGGEQSDTDGAIRRLAAATGLCCVLPDGRSAGVLGAHDRLALGLLWSPGIEPVPDSFHWQAEPFWHGFAAATFTVAGHRLAVASYHAPPSAGRDRRPFEAEALSVALTAATTCDRFLGGDFNAPSASRRGDDGYYDPDPTDWVTDADRARWGDDLPEVGYPTDWRSGELLQQAGWLDLAPMLEAPWEPTTGHWPTERNGRRRLDRLYLRPGTAARTDGSLPRSRVVGCRVHDSPLAREASDHLPFSCTIRIAADQR
ncbi:endonuclease/exonuclease/phosphatase family protein [Plantactinospora sp. CA-290183]|uniref:endonuclease/exonuclease/phosphatase family protein n=1 Tax=Plantactinospora sp. CA-290183 TaxID=3240006 RepID=UPI003D929FEC